MKDLVLLVADQDLEFAVRGLFERSSSLGIRDVTFDLYRHPQRDSGCYARGHDLLRPFTQLYSHALVIFDRDGCGREDLGRQGIESEVGIRLQNSGWGDRAAVIAIDPELEAWVWSDSPNVARCLGWLESYDNLKAWLGENGFWQGGASKPADPKAAVESVLRQTKKPRSSSLYRQLAKSVSLRRCVDPAFSRFREILSDWFGTQG